MSGFIVLGRPQRTVPSTAITYSGPAFRPCVQSAPASACENQLRHAVAIAQVNEESPAQVAAAMDPAHQQGALAGIGGAQFAAGMRAAKVA
jgi:hypothetical protein